MNEIDKPAPKRTPLKIIIPIKFRGIDDWNHPVYKQVNRDIYFGSMYTSVPDAEKGLTSNKEINAYFRKHLHEIEFFGDHFNCEPHGGNSPRWIFQIIED